MQYAKASVSCVTVPPNGSLVKSTLFVAIKYGTLLFAYAALDDKFIALQGTMALGTGSTRQLP